MLTLCYTTRLDIGAALSEIKDAWKNVGKWAKQENAYVLCTVTMLQLIIRVQSL